MQTQCFSSLILCWTWAGFWTECLTSLGWTGLERKIWPITVSFILFLDFGTWEGAGQTWSGVLLRDHFHCVVLSVTQMTKQTPLSLFCSQTFSINTPMFLSTHCLLPYMRAFAQVADSKTCCLLHIMFVNDNTTVYVFILCHLWLSGCWMHLPPVDLSPEISPHFPYNHQNC